MKDDPKIPESNLNYLNRIRETFPELAVWEVESPPEGLANDVLIINRERVFRFPKDGRTKESLGKEARVLTLASVYVDMRLPVFDYVEADFVSYPFIPGTVLSRETILRQDDQTQDRLAKQLADFLRQLHTIPMAELERHDIPLSEAVRSYEDYVQMFEDVQQALFPLLWRDGKAWVRQHFEPVLADRNWLAYEPALINGDLASYHIMYDETEPKINGIIDFGVAGIGDPADDIALMLSTYGETFLRRMAKYYPQIGKHIERARFMVGALELEWVIRGIQNNDLSMFTVHLGRARDVMPIGSGWSI